MDYLLRDARMCGVSYGNYDLPQIVASVVPAPEGKFGGGGIAVRAAGLHAAEGLLLARALIGSTQVKQRPSKKVIVAEDFRVRETFPTNHAPAFL
jgi:hypothetical protein